MAYCNAPSPHWPTFRQKYGGEFLREAAARDDGQTLYVQVRYVSLYHTEDQKVELVNVQDAHRGMNIAFAGANASERAKIPNTGFYPWQSVVGTPNIQFLPLDASQVTVEYIQVDVTELDGQAPVDDASRRGGITPGVLNVYFGNASQGILGQALLGANVVYNLYSTVGGPTVKGSLAHYDGGKTLIHEVGHALSLPHTFADDMCDNRSVYPDIPEQTRPNFSTSLFQQADGSWTCAGDNRDQDRATGTHLSCLSIQPDPAAAPNEQGINYMDYGSDDVSIMFSQGQCLMMRTWLTGPENNALTLQPAPVAAVTGTTLPVAAVSTVSTLTTSDDTASVSTTTSSTSLSWVTIMALVMGGLVILLAMYWVLKGRMRPVANRTVDNDVRQVLVVA